MGGVLRSCSFWMSKCLLMVLKAELKSKKRIQGKCLRSLGAGGQDAAGRGQRPLCSFFPCKRIGGGPVEVLQTGR